MGRALVHDRGVVLPALFFHHGDAEGTEDFTLSAHRENAMGKNNLPLHGIVMVSAHRADTLRLPSSSGKRKKDVWALSVSLRWPRML